MSNSAVKFSEDTTLPNGNTQHAVGSEVDDWVQQRMNPEAPDQVKEYRFWTQEYLRQHPKSSYGAEVGFFGD